MNSRIKNKVIVLTLASLLVAFPAVHIFAQEEAPSQEPVAVEEVAVSEVGEVETESATPTESVSPIDSEPEPSEENESEEDGGSIIEEPKTVTITENMGDATVQTGASYAEANIINVVNTNILNSEGFIYLLNNFLGGFGSIDLRFFDLGNILNSCSISCTATGTTHTEIQGSNEANIINDVVVRSETGSNTAYGENAYISTGNAYAGANVVNMVNTNIVNSNYLVFAFNNFGDWSGDIIFENSDFFSSFFNPQLEVVGRNTELDVENANTASVENSISTEGVTGENLATGTEAVIETGNSLSNSNVHNTVNQNFLGQSNVLLVFRIFGDWSGSVFNAPDNVQWAETQNGLELYGTPTNTLGGGGLLNISNTNDVNLKNNVKVFALTGINKVSASTNAQINTGDAYAGSNTVNLVNTNIVSSNWILAIVNIFGNWRGNVSFGQPDLWIGSRVESVGNVDPGEIVTVHTSIANRGDAPAHNIDFKHSINTPHLSFVDEKDVSVLQKEISLLRPGQVIEYVYEMRVKSELYGNYYLTSTLNAEGVETDGNPADNTDEITLAVYNNPVFVAPLNLTSYTTTYPNLTITKTNNVNGPIEASSTVDYTVKIKNTGGEAFESVLIDELKNQKGEVISTQEWGFNTIKASEEITVTYTAVFSSTTLAGIYTNYAHVEAVGGDYLNHPALGTKVHSPTASSSIIVEAYKSKIEVSSETPLENYVEITPTGTLRNGPQSSLLDQSLDPLEFDIPTPKKKFGLKELLASVFSIVLFMRSKRD